MADRPILFSGPMVQALLAGRKTQTRRLAKFVSEQTNGNWHCHGNGAGMMGMDDAQVRQWGHTYSRFEVGDRLYVREEWRVGKKWDETKPSLLPARSMSVLYGAGGCAANVAGWGYLDKLGAGGMPDWAGRRRAGFHMPRWASRLTLTVTDVRVERLQDCSEQDAWAEGLSGDPSGTPFIDVGDRMLAADAAAYCYRMLWDHINGEGAWAENPWIVAVSFDVLKGNIDD